MLMRFSFGLYLAAAGEALVVAWYPAGAVSVVLVLEEAGVRILLQLLRVLHKEVIKFSLLHVSSGSKLAVVWYVDLQRQKGDVEAVQGFGRCVSHI